MGAVISDTSPIQALRCLGLLGLLPDFFDEVFVPPAVVAELAAPASGLPVFSVEEVPWLIVRAPTNSALVGSLVRSLGLGESEAIALAVELRAEALLIDERKGRAHATRSGLNVTGTLGLLLRAKATKRIDRLAPLLASLESKISFRVSGPLREKALRIAGE